MSDQKVPKVRYELYRNGSYVGILMLAPSGIGVANPEYTVRRNGSGKNESGE